MKLIKLLLLLSVPLLAQTNKAFYFDGSTIAKKDTVAWRSGDSQGTISFWLKLDETQDDNDAYFTSSNSTSSRYIRIKRTTTNVVQISEKNNDTTTGVASVDALDAGTWHWITVVSSGTAYTIYIDSVKQSLTVSTGNTGDWFADIIGRDDLVLGGEWTTSAIITFTGWMDDVFVSSDAKNAAWVQSTFTAYAAGTADLTEEANGVAYWRMDNDLLDAIGTTHLTVTGTTTFADGAFSYPVIASEKKTFQLYKKQKNY